MNTLTAPPLFVGRAPLRRRLEALWRRGQGVLLLGQPGAGKTTLVAQLAQTHPVCYAPRCGHLGEFLGALEPQAGLERDGLKLAPRVHRLAAELPKLRRPLVIDNVAHVPPRVAHLVRVLLGAMPVWLLARSTLPLEIGHVWPYLFAFKRVDLPPFSPDETRAFLAAAPFPGERAELLAATLRLHRLASGHPGTLAALVEELRGRTHDLRTTEGLRLLALHARITRVEAQLAAR